MPAKILVVEDDPGIRMLVASTLKSAGLTVLEARDGVEAMDFVPEADLVVLDVGLPRQSGWEVLEAIRQNFGQLPVLMLTGHADETNRVRGLESGADDYLTKPFSVRELAARVKALLRRSGRLGLIVMGSLKLSPGSREAWLDNDTLHLTPLEFDLLMTLAQAPGRIFSREELLVRHWGAEYEGTERVVDIYVGRLRKKLLTESDRLETVWGQGYRLRGD
jgi:two-component system alkaline phosphatase synthesis response regulator PhoP